MYELNGAKITGSQVEFSLFFPDNTVDPSQYVRGGLPKISKIVVTGDFQNQLGSQDWDFSSAPALSKSAHANGWIYRCSLPKPLKAGFYQYKYFVTFENGTTRWCTDPCSKYGGSDDNGNSAFVVGGNTATVQPLTNRLPMRDLVIFECMLDDFTAEFRGARAPVDAFWDKLAYLQTLGVNAIEFMPWTAWDGSDFSWGYNPVQFFSVEYRYINDATAVADKLVRLKNLFSELHGRGMHVIMDSVFNHVVGSSDPSRGFGYRWLYQDPGDSPYIGSFAGGGFFDDLDYNNGCTQQFIRDVCNYWIDLFQIDGIRFDYTLGFYSASHPEEGITRLISDIKGHLIDVNKQNVALIIEHLTDNRYDAIHDTNLIGAGGCWFDPIMWQLQQYANNGAIDSSALRVLNASYQFDSDKGPVTYAENHDHSTIVQQVGGRGRWYKTQPAAIALLTAPGTPMIHNGQEFGEQYWMPESGDGRVMARPLHWNSYGSDAVGKQLQWLYGLLIQLRKDHPCLRSANFYPFPNNDAGYGAFTDRGIIIYHRWGTGTKGAFERFTIALNFTDTDQWIDIPLYGVADWSDLLNGTSVHQTDGYARNHRVNSNWGCVFFSAV